MNAASGQSLYDFRAGEGVIGNEIQAEFGPNCSRVAYVGSCSRAVRILDWPPATVATRTESEGEILDIALSADGRRAAALGVTNVTVWNTSTGERVHDLRLPFGGLNVGPSQIAISPDGTRVAAPCWDTTIRVFDMTTGEENLCLDHATDHPYRPKPLHGPALDDWRQIAGPRGTARSISFSDNGQAIAALCLDGHVRVWNTRDGSLLCSVPSNRKVMVGTTLFAFFPGGFRLVTAVGAEAVVWEVEGGAEIERLPAHECDIRALAVSPDGRVLAALDQKELRLWDTSKSRVTRRLSGTQSKVSFEGLRFRHSECVVWGHTGFGYAAWNVHGEIILPKFQLFDDCIDAQVSLDWRPFPLDGETVVESVTAQTWLAAWPKELHRLRRVPDSPVWVGHDGRCLVIIALEGAADVGRSTDFTG